MTTLGDAQKEFSRLVPRLIDKAHEMGFEVTLGDTYRDPRAFGAVGVFKSYGNASSAHKQRLALDLNLFRDGEFLTATRDHEPLGAWWESQHFLARWGGRFADGNHYSFEWGGVK